MGANNLNTILEDPTPNSGTSVAALISGMVSDPDPAAPSGVAVIGFDNSQGVWQYSMDGGTTWTAFGSPSNITGRLLAADANSFVRFIPNANWNGSTSINLRAWDQSVHTAGTVVETSANGGSTPFSATAETATLPVVSVNDAPAGTSGTVTTNEDTRTFSAP